MSDAVARRRRAYETKPRSEARTDLRDTLIYHTTNTMQYNMSYEARILQTCDSIR